MTEKKRREVGIGGLGSESTGGVLETTPPGTTPYADGTLVVPDCDVTNIYYNTP
jgi:hypothetical protein